MIIGLGYKARSGKDTIAEHWYRTRRWATEHFARPLKDAAAIIFDLDEEQLHGSRKGETDERWGMTPREILQKLGTEAIRGTFGPDVWIKSMAAEIARRGFDGVTVIPDVRFRNEADWIKSTGGIVLCINCFGGPGIDAQASTHASEVELDDYDFDARIGAHYGEIANLLAKADREVNYLFRERGIEL